MTPEQLRLLTPEEAAAWATCEASDLPWADMGDAGTGAAFPGEVRRCSDFAFLLEDPEGDATIRHFLGVATVALPTALETIATLRADLATEQARHTRAWKALCAIGEALDKAGHPTLIPERALRVGEAVDALVAERDGLRAELARLKSAWIGMPIGVNDRDGNPVHIGDTLAFDGREWDRATPNAPDHLFVVEFRKGDVSVCGTVSDIPSFCRVVKRWDEPTKETP